MKLSDFNSFPFVYVDLPSAKIAEQMIRRSVLIGMIMEVFSEGKSIEEVIETADTERMDSYIKSTETFKFAVKIINKKIR